MPGPSPRDYRQDPRAASKRGFAAALLLICLAGGGLMLAPPAVHDALRSVILDGLAPGQIAEARFQQTAARLVHAPPRSSGDEETARLQRERDLWRRRCLELQHRHAELAERMGGSSGQHSTPYRARAGAPLLIPELLTARVIGARGDALSARISRILDRGAVGGVAVDDLVLSDEAAHLDHGSSSGVVEDLPVFAGRSIVGRIAQVGRWTSTVQPVTDPDFRGFAQIVRDSLQGPVLGAKGVIAGNGDGTCRLELVAVTDPVSVGDEVYTVSTVDGDGGRLHYGRIVAADYRAGASHWSITVASQLDGVSLDSVQILRESLNPARIAAPSETDEGVGANIQQTGAVSDAAQ